MDSYHDVLNNLTTEELKNLCNLPTDERYEHIIDHSDEVKTIIYERDLMRESVKSSALCNVSEQNRYEFYIDKMLNLVGDCNKLREDVQVKHKTLLDLLGKPVETTLRISSEAAIQIEDESENIAQSFLDNSIDLVTFYNQYLEKRILAYMKRIIADKLRRDRVLISPQSS